MSTNEALVLLAYKKGYRVTPNGTLINAVGRPRKTITKGGYQFFTMKNPITKISTPVAVHRIVALQEFEEAAFLTAPCVRHLNGNSLDNRPKNIALGTHKDNAMDRPPHERQAHAESAALHNIRADWSAIDTDRAAGMSYKQLRKKHQVPLATLSYRYGKGKRRSRKIETR